MRIVSFALMAIILAGQAHAIIIPLSGNRSVNAGGVAGGLDGNQSYSYSHTSSAISGDFNGNVGGTASWTDTTPWYPGLQPGSYHVESQAIQNSSITSDEISLNGSVRGSGLISMQGPYLGASTSAGSVFEMSFQLLTATEFLMSLNMSVYWHDMARPQVDFSLTSLAHGDVVNMSQIWNQQYDGLLEPDVYFLRLNVSAGTVPDPFGDSQGVDYGLNMKFVAQPEATVAAVPDGGSTAALFGIALVGLGTLRRKSR